MIRGQPWRRLAVLRAKGWRHAERLAGESVDGQDPVPPLVCPDDDREFVSVWLPREPAGGPDG